MLNRNRLLENNTNTDQNTFPKPSFEKCLGFTLEIDEIEAEHTNTNNDNNENAMYKEATNPPHEIRSQVQNQVGREK